LRDKSAKFLGFCNTNRVKFLRILHVFLNVASLGTSLGGALCECKGPGIAVSILGFTSHELTHITNILVKEDQPQNGQAQNGNRYTPEQLVWWVLHALLTFASGIMGIFAAQDNALKVRLYWASTACGAASGIISLFLLCSP
jgi:hypothetical protein